MSHFYRDLLIPACPNLCFEQIIDRAILQNTANGIEPKLNRVGGQRTWLEVRRYSIKLKRHSTRAQGNAESAQWRFCPHCGERLLSR